MSTTLISQPGAAGRLEPSGEAHPIAVEPRLTRRAPQGLRLHPAYEALVGHHPAPHEFSTEGAPNAPEEPVVVTASGTVIRRHGLWHRALAQHRATVLCLEHDVDDDVALAMIIQSQQGQGRLNAFCRVELALRLERVFKKRCSSEGPAAGGSSNLTERRGIDVRRELAKLAAVSSGNITKVKQILSSAAPEVLQALRQGSVSIHRAWLWRDFSHTAQRDALWSLGQRPTDQLIRELIAAQTRPEPKCAEGDRLAILEGLRSGIAIPFRFVVLDVPEAVLVVSATLRDHLKAKRS